MNELLIMLRGGDLRSDGRANDVANEVIKKYDLMGQLIEGLDDSGDVVRARTAHALERISRTDKQGFLKLMPKLARLAIDDRVPMVRWHVTKILGDIALLKEATDPATSA